MNTKALLLFALVVCTASALSIAGGSSRCLCQSFRDNLKLPRKLIKSMQIFSPSNSCDKMEIIVNLTSGPRVCLNPNIQKVRDILKKLETKKRTF